MNSKQARNPTCGLRDVLRRVVDAGSHITASARADQADTETLTRADALSVYKFLRSRDAGTAGRGDSKSTSQVSFKSSQIKSSLACLFKRNLFTALHCCHQGSQPGSEPL